MKKIVFLLIAICSLFLFSIKTNASELAQNAKSACLIDTSSNTILFEKDKDSRLAPASMTKIMTLTLIYEYIEENEISKDTMVKGSEHAKSMGGSQVYLEVDETLSVDDMLKCICICSANDCAVAMAEFVSGSESVFVDKMNEKVEELGLKNTHFEDATGLTSTNHYSSAYDMAIMSSNLINKYPDVLNYTNIREDYIRKNTESPFWLVNTNKAIGKVDGVDGLKTGWTVSAGYCISLTKSKDNMRLISVVMGYKDSVVRNVQALELLNYGFSNYTLEIIYKKGTIVYVYESILYKPEKMNFIFDEDVYVLRKKSDKVKDKYYEIIDQPNFGENIPGKLIVYYGEDKIKEVTFSAESELRRKNIFELWLDVLKGIIF